LRRQEKHQDKHQVKLSGIQLAVLKALENKSLSRREIFAAIGMNGDSRSYRRNIEPLLTGGLIEMTVPDKPNSRLQKYRLTDSGMAAIGDKTT
jgi:predicted transcriptional regulator